MAQPKILVIRGGAIGDFVLTFPVLAALREQFPDVRLEVLGYAHIAELALAGGLADAVRSIDAISLAGFFARGGSLSAELTAYFAEFPLIISYLYDPDRIFQTNVGRCSRAQFIACPHRPDEKAGVHACKVFLQPLERLAIFEADPVPRLPIAPVSPIVDSQTAPPTRPVRLALHPGSGSERKNWPEPKWLELLERIIQQTDWELLLVAGEAEGNRLERVTPLLPLDRYHLAHNLPLAELAGRFRQCDAFLGHDSGISHLAAAVGLPGVVLWGETVEAVWRPPSSDVTVISDSGGLSEITAGRVLAGVRSVVGQ